MIKNLLCRLGFHKDRHVGFEAEGQGMLVYDGGLCPDLYVHAWVCERCGRESYAVTDIPHISLLKYSTYHNKTSPAHISRHKAGAVTCAKPSLSSKP